MTWPLPQGDDAHGAAHAGTVLDNAFGVEHQRNAGSTTSFYRALMHSLEPKDQAWVEEVVARHRALEREADARGETLPHAVW